MRNEEVARPSDARAVFVRLPDECERFEGEHRGVGEADAPRAVEAAFGALLRVEVAYSGVDGLSVPNQVNERTMIREIGTHSISSLR